MPAINGLGTLVDGQPQGVLLTDSSGEVVWPPARHWRGDLRPDCAGSEVWQPISHSRKGAEIAAAMARWRPGIGEIGR